MAEPRVDRRLAAILCADVVGYSRLIEQDETGTVGALKNLRRDIIDPMLARHHGRLVQTTGDGTLVEFGSVVDAVLCAVALQKAVADGQAAIPSERRLTLRIGVNLGDVVADGADILGDGVNVAARLEQLCEPGGVLVSETVREHVGNRIDLAFDDIGPQMLKNIERPIRAHRLRVTGAAAGIGIHPRRSLACSSSSGPSPRSRCCRSRTSAAIRIKTISAKASPRT